MIIEGKKIAKEILDDISNRIRELDRIPYLALVCVSGASESRQYLEIKKSMAKTVGIESKIYEFPNDITTQELRKKLVTISKNKSITGVIVELPLPGHINTQYVLNAVPEEKDPDMLSQKAQGSFFVGRSAMIPPAAYVLKQIFEHYAIEPTGKTVAVFGRGLLIGKPVAHWLSSQGATVSVITENTENPGTLSSCADIIVAGVGKPGLVTSDMVKDGAVVIDFGYTKVGDKAVGDVDFKNVEQKANLITPVPGGAGPVGIATALYNAVMLVSKK